MLQRSSLRPDPAHRRSSQRTRRRWLTACLATTATAGLVLTTSPQTRGTSTDVTAQADPDPTAGATTAAATSAQTTAATAAPATTPVAAVATETPVLSVSDANAAYDDANDALASADAELSAATTTEKAARAAVTTSATSNENAQRELGAAELTADLAEERSRDSDQAVSAVDATAEAVQAGAVLTIQPAAALDVGVPVEDAIAPLTDAADTIAEVVEKVDVAEAVQRSDRVALVSAQTREKVAGSMVDVAAKQQDAADVALAEATTRLDTATTARAAATTTVAQAEEVKAAADAAAEEARIARERAEAAAAADRAAREAEALAAREMQRPGTGGITSPYGMRTHPLTGVYKLHSGTDFGVGDGKARAARAGTVTGAGYEGAYGNMVTISHGTIDGGTVETRYAHLSSPNVSVGQEVAAGDVVGQIGTTGSSTGPHLHFEVLVDGEFDGPMTWLGN